MKREHTEEWDWPPTRGRGRYRAYSRFDVYQPKGWDWPIRKKIINIWWRVMIISIKLLLTVALTIMAFGATWLTVTLIRL